MKAFLFALALPVILFSCTMQAPAQTVQCAGLPDFLAALDRNYGERIVWEGIWQKPGQPEAKLIITGKPDGSTWTALVVLDGQACLVASGSGWAGGSALNGEAI